MILRRHLAFPVHTSDDPAMTLTEEQKQQVSQWIEDGLKLADIQSQLDQTFGLRCTYMDVRLLVDDLKLTPKETVIPEPVAPPAEALPDPLAPAAAGGGVKISVDQVTRPGAMVSGRVTFSDGVAGEWHLDQRGQLGLAGTPPAYRPSEADVADFQASLDQELARQGF